MIHETSEITQIRREARYLVVLLVSLLLTALLNIFSIQRHSPTKCQQWQECQRHRAAKLFTQKLRQAQVTADITEYGICELADRVT